MKNIYRKGMCCMSENELQGLGGSGALLCLEAKQGGLDPDTCGCLRFEMNKWGSCLEKTAIVFQSLTHSFVIHLTNVCGPDNPI